MDRKIIFIEGKNIPVVGYFLFFVDIYRTTFIASWISAGMPFQIPANTTRALFTRGVETLLDRSALRAPDVSLADGFTLQ